MLENRNDILSNSFKVRSSFFNEEILGNIVSAKIDKYTGVNQDVFLSLTFKETNEVKTYNFIMPYMESKRRANLRKSNKTIDVNLVDNIGSIIGGYTLQIIDIVKMEQSELNKMEENTLCTKLELKCKLLTHF